MVREAFAYAFDTALSIAEMFERLNTRGPWRWIERENDRWGDYISARAIDAPHEGIAKILYDDELRRFAINVELASEVPAPQAAFDRVRALVLSQILPAIDARDIAEAEDYSS
jgi:hypothetical protein